MAEFQRTQDTDRSVAVQQVYTIEGDFALIVDQMLKVPANDQADAMHTGDRYMSRIVSQTPRLKSPAISFIIGPNEHGC